MCPEVNQIPVRRWVSVRKSSLLFDGTGIVCEATWNPYLGYRNGSYFWSSHLQKDNMELEKMQRKSMGMTQGTGT